MKIHIGTGAGTGPTTLAAFDAALIGMGIANYNLIYLSSVVPPQAEVITHDGHIDANLPGGWGDRLYVVMAEIRADTPNEEAWAGVGWVQDPETGKGLFVEHEGRSEQTVRSDITQTLQGLMKNRNVDFGEIHMVVRGITCVDQPVCAMVTAVYQSSDWHNNASVIGE